MYLLLASMHRCFCVDEILRLIAQELVAVEEYATAVALACCSKQFEDPALDTLWSTQPRFLLLMNTLPDDIWSPDGYKVSMATATPVHFALILI